MKIQELMDNITATYAHPIRSINKYSKSLPKENSQYRRIGRAIGLEMMRVGLFLSYLLVIPAILGLIGRITEKPPNREQSNRIESQAQSLVSQTDANFDKSKKPVNAEDESKVLVDAEDESKEPVNDVDKGSDQVKKEDDIGAIFNVSDIDERDRFGQTALHRADDTSTRKTSVP